MTDPALDVLLEKLALKGAAGGARRGLAHGSRLARVEAGSWQAEMVARADGVFAAQCPFSLKSLMHNPDVAIVFFAARGNGYR